MRTMSLLLLALLIGPGAPGAIPEPGVSREALDTVLDLRIIETVLHELLDREESLPECPEWIDLDELAKELPRAYRSRLPREDGWGRKYKVQKLDGQWFVASSGADGVQDAVRAGKTTLRDENDPGEDYPIGDDLMLALGEGLVNVPPSRAQRSRRAMASLRSLATAIESYSIDHNEYPLQPDGLKPIEVVGSSLAPVYIRRLPRKDPWGSDFLFWSDGSSYMLVSFGEDGAPDRSYAGGLAAFSSSMFRGGTKDASADILFVDGRFVEWPVLGSSR